nr:YHYH protein [uncultured Arsenicibacter sp.]
MKTFFLITLSLGIGLFACKKESSDSSVTPSTTTLADAFKKFNSTLSVSVDGNYVVIKSTGIPDHKSPYFSATSSQYEAYNGTNAQYRKNPNSISTQNLVFRIPLTPTKASSPQATPLGPIGVSINGVPFFNQYAGPSQPLTNEINSFDQYNGHPQQTGQYHYHVEPTYLTKVHGSGALLGFLLDGYPVYGPVENGKAVMNSDLDAYHGHSHATTDYPGGIYHYHITAQDPYINGNGFYGNPGTVSQ